MQSGSKVHSIRFISIHTEAPQVQMPRCSSMYASMQLADAQLNGSVRKGDKYQFYYFEKKGVEVQVFLIAIFSYCYKYTDSK